MFGHFTTCIKGLKQTVKLVSIKQSCSYSKAILIFHNLNSHYFKVFCWFYCILFYLLTVNLLLLVYLLSIPYVEMYSEPCPASRIVLYAKLVNPFSTNVPVKDKPGNWFLLAKSLKSTCRRVTFC